MELSDFKTFDPRSIKGFNPQDLKKLSFEDIKALIMPKKWEALAILIAIVGIIASSQLYSFNSNRITELNSRLALLQGKEDPITQLNKTLDEARTLFASLPKGLDDTTFIPAITETAKKFGIRITDFDPPTMKKFPYYTVTSSKILCTSRDFKTLLKFIHSLESAEYAMRVETLTIGFTQTMTADDFSKKKRGPAGDGMYNATLSLSSTKITTPQPPPKGKYE